MSEDWPKSHEIFPFYQFQEMDLSLLSDLFLLSHPFSKLPSPLPTPGCVLFIHFPVLVLLKDTICPKAFANLALNHSHHQNQFQHRAAGGIWEAGTFPDGEQCTEAQNPWQPSAFSNQPWICCVIQDRLCCLFGSSHF